MQVEQMTNRRGLGNRINQHKVDQTNYDEIQQSLPYVNCANGDKYFATNAN